MTSQILENRFEIESQLTCTDFSRVYLAGDRRHPHRPLCLITAIPYHQREIRHRLEREAHLLERLGRHPQIPRVLTYFHKSGDLSGKSPREQKDQIGASQPLGTFYLIQDHIEGHPLSEELTPHKRLSESYVSQLIKDVLVALTFAHEQGLAHQNLHPQHLIREARDGQIFVTHFGAIAKIARSKVAADGSLGCSIPVSPHPYSAPEQLRAATNGTDKPRPASDLYALGLIAIEALTGERHHHFSYEAQRGLQWRTQAEVSIPLAEFIDRLIRHDWRDRFTNAKDALATFRDQSDRDRIAKDSRLPTAIAAPGTRGREPFSFSYTQASPSQFTGTQPVKKALSPTFFKFVIGSVALLIALGISVKAYQWGEYRFSLLPKMGSKIGPQLWQNWRWQGPSWGGSPKDLYAAADPKALTPLLEDGSILLQPAAAEAFWQMVVAAQSDGIALYPLSGYVPDASKSTSGRASKSDYATGYAVDITTGDRADLDRQAGFAATPAFQWLKRNAQRYGFELSSLNDRRLGGRFKEPWHWRYVGDDPSRQVLNH